MAQKFFGNVSPVGKTLALYADLETKRKTMTISGVFKNTPKNSSLQFQFLTHLENQLDGDKARMDIGRETCRPCPYCLPRCRARKGQRQAGRQQRATVEAHGAGALFG